MNALRSWIARQLAPRPAWMNALMLVCIYMSVVFMPWDFFVKPLLRPLAEAEEVWFGVILHGWWAKLTEPVHWAIYAAGWYGFARMRSWMWPWAAVYAAQLTIAMVVWPLLYVDNNAAPVLSVASAALFGAVTWKLWSAVDLFAATPAPMSARYGGWAVVTGASAGIGREFARALAAEGMSCVLVARRRERLVELASELERGFGVGVHIVDADLSTSAGVDAVVAACEGLDVGMLVNNAGVGAVGRIAGQQRSRLEAMVQLNCTAVVGLTSALLPGLLARGKGAVIFVGSVAGRQPIPLHAVYSATKGFDLLFGEGLWGELLGTGVDVTVLQPGPVATEFEAVAGEARVDSSADEDPVVTVRCALEALGKRPSVISGRFNALRGNVNRFLPRALVALIAREVMQSQTPPETR
jgi:short-subunit dehydrogenase